MRTAVDGQGGEIVRQGALNLPDLIIHADWSVRARKRCVARGRRHRGSYLVSGLDYVGDCGSFVREIEEEVKRTPRTLLGFDFPIGLPRLYATKAGISSFLELLPNLGSTNWPNFFNVAHAPGEVSVGRPFYPNRSRGVLRQDLVGALGLERFDDLRRRCEQARPGRRAACPLFWTLGGNQVGKGAIVGLRDVIIPLLRDLPGEAWIWPFDGTLNELLQRRGVIVAETYPAEVYSHLDIRLGPGGKRRQDGRRAASAAIQNWAARTETNIDELRKEIDDAFGSGASGEDRFDALIGLLGMINVVLGHRPAMGDLDDPSVVKVEGWILGQTEAC
jgi:hypothetical protein